MFATLQKISRIDQTFEKIVWIPTTRNSTPKKDKIVLKKFDS